MNYKIIRSVSDKHLHIIFEEGPAPIDAQVPGSDPFQRVPQQLRALGPWQGLSKGEVEDLKPHYRLLLAEQGFTVIYSHMSYFSPESRTRNPVVD